MDSIWKKNCFFESGQSLQEDKSVDVAVIGGGITGILTARLLHDAGVEVAVVESSAVGDGQTQNTTAKITAQHGAIYDKLIQSHDVETAKLYAEANMQAIKDYEALICTKQIDCDFERTDAYLYAKTDLPALQKEYDASKTVGLPVDMVVDTDLPFSTVSAIKMREQAQFHPLKFLYSVARGLRIYDNTSVIKVKENTIETSGGNIKAEMIIFACHFPFVNFPGLYFSRMHTDRSYVIALENADAPDGMYIGIEENTVSLRKYGELLLLGGGSHRTGENHTGGKYEYLRDLAAKWWPNSHEVAHWSAQDCMTTDSIPYIGQFSSAHKNWFVATGFNKWGMSSAMVAATVLRDTVCGHDNKYAKVFSPNRFSTADIPQTVHDSAHAVRGISREIFVIPKQTVSDMPIGHGGVVTVDGKKAGVYKKSEEEVFVVDTRCPHLGCELSWNPDEKSWDCPCHGSRFDYQGNLINGPAQCDIGLA